MPDRNALPLIVRALEEKAVEVVLPEGGNPVKGYLIKISGDVNSFQDFRDMYQNISGRPYEKAFRRLRRENPGLLQNHGVLIDPETLRIFFTFNMAFADLHRPGRRLVRFPLAEIFPVVIPDYYGKPCRDGEPCFGERARRLVEKYGYVPRGKVANCFPSFRDALAPHTVFVQLPGETDTQPLCLIKIWAKTNFEDDYKTAYPDSSRGLIPIPSGKDEFREYGLFISPARLRLVFAFNTQFANYNPQTKTVEYLTPGKNILKDLEAAYEPTTTPMLPPHIPRRRRHGGMHGVIMYALSKPREKKNRA